MKVREVGTEEGFKPVVIELTIDSFDEAHALLVAANSRSALTQWMENTRLLEAPDGIVLFRMLEELRNVLIKHI